MPVFIESPTFPTPLSYGAMGGPRFTTEVVMTQGGQEQRNRRWAQPLHRYELGLRNLDEEQTQLLVWFFETVAIGRANAFRFHDFVPGQGTLDNEVLLAAPGSPMLYPLTKNYQAGEGLPVLRRRVYKPIFGTMSITEDYLPASGVTLDYTTGMITFSSSPGGTIRASGEFDVPVRFDVDALQASREAPTAWTWDSVPLVEVRILTSGPSAGHPVSDA